MEILSQEKTNQLIQILRNNFISYFQIIHSFSPEQADNFRKRNVFYQNQKDKKQCCKSGNKIQIPKEQQTFLERRVSEVTSKSYMYNNWSSILEYLSETFNNIKSKGLEESLSLDSKTEKYLISETLKTGILKQVRKLVQQELEHNYKLESQQPMLLATPQTWKNSHPDIQLDSLQPGSLKQLHEEAFANQAFINHKFALDLFHQLDYLELNQKFSSAKQPDREDSVIWLNLLQIQQNQFKYLYFICQMLSSLPYELNAKTQYYVIFLVFYLFFKCQISEQF